MMTSLHEKSHASKWLKELLYNKTSVHQNLLFLWIFQSRPYGCCSHSTATFRYDRMWNKRDKAGTVSKIRQEIKQKNELPAVLWLNQETNFYLCTVHAIVPAWIPAILSDSSPLNPPEWKQAPPCCFHTPSLIMWNSWQQGAGSREVNEELQ